jgi:hypothetical protein
MHHEAMNRPVTSATGLRMHRSAIAACFVVRRKNNHKAVWDFFDSIGQNLKSPLVRVTSALPPKADMNLTVVRCPFSVQNADIAFAHSQPGPGHQFNDPLRVVAFNTLEHRAKDVSEDIAAENSDPARYGGQ